MQSLAQKLGVSKKEFNMWLFGKKKIPSKHLKKLSQELKVEETFLGQKFEINISKNTFEDPNSKKIDTIYNNLDLILKNIRK